jgi:hypothetical protein
MELNLTTNTTAEEKILQYLKENASETLANKINNGTSFEKDGKPLLNKKTLSGFMKYACDEARKLAEKGANSACIDDATVYGWAVHYFEEESIEGTLYTLDGEEYKPVTKTKNTQKSTYTPTSTPKQQNQQASLFDIISQENNAVDTTEKEQPVIQNKEEPTEEMPKVETKQTLSPVYVEYKALKEKYLDYVIAYRLGDFYEILGKDAATIASELDLTLTGRECGLAYRIPMVGFPYHAAELYFGKIARKHNLAICENDKDIQLIDKINIDDNRLIDQDTGEILNQKDYTTNNMIKILYSIFGNNIEVKL